MRMLIVVLRQTLLMSGELMRRATRPLGTGRCTALAIALSTSSFALFPLFWLLKVSVTPNDLLYTEGIRLWPSRTSFEHLRFVLRHSDFPLFFRNSVIVSGSTAAIVDAARLGCRLCAVALRLPRQVLDRRR